MTQFCGGICLCLKKRDKQNIRGLYIAEKKWEKNLNWSKLEEIIQRLLLNVGNVKMLWT